MDYGELEVRVLSNMKSEEFIDKLRKAGINASLVHKIHDEELYNIEPAKVGRLMPPSEDGELSLKQIPKQYYTPVYMDYTTKTGSDMSDEKAKEIAEGLHKAYKEAQEATTVAFPELDKTLVNYLINDSIYTRTFLNMRRGK